MRRLPKAEVHVHLEGTFESEALEQLSAESGEQLPRPIDRLLEFRDLGDLLAFLDWACSLVRTPEQLARAAYRFADREAAAGVRYADLIVNPTHWPAWHGRLEAMLDALDGGLREAEVDGLTPVGLCVSLRRDQSAQQALELVDQLIERRHPRVVAISIDGNEAATGRTGPRFAEAFRRAEAAGLRRTVHAGESSGPQGVRDAIEHLRAQRIDHGVRASEDPHLVRELAERGIPLAVCPRSNLLLGLYADRAAHPIDRMRRAGVRVSINTDDPALLRTEITQEYLENAEAYGWGPGELREMARTSIESSFADDDARRAMLAELEVWRP
jgi:adenosine deaminase